MSNFWLDDYNILFKDYLNFFPNKTMSKVDNLNALTRFFIYAMILLVLFDKDEKYVYICMICIMFIIGYYKFNIVEKYDNSDLNYDNYNGGEKCQLPTYNNPFMNTNIINDNKDNLPACNIMNDNINKKSQEYFDMGLNKSIEDAWNIKNAQRQFYTTPSTTIPNKQDEFAQFCYGTDKTCKEGGNCLKYEDLKYKRRL